MIRQLTKCIREYKAPTIWTLVLILAEVAIDVIIPFETANLINEVKAGAELGGIVRVGLVLVLLAMISLVCGGAAGFTGSKAASGFAKNVRHDLFTKVQGFSFENIDKFSSASLVTRMTTDIQNVQMAYMMCIRIAVRAPLMMIFSIIMAFIMGGRLALTFVVIVPVLVVGLFFIAREAMPAFRAVFRKYDKLNESVEENVRAMRVVKGFARESYETKKFTAASDNIRGDFTHAERVVALNSPLMQLCVYFNMVFVLFVGSKLIITNGGTTIDVGQLSAMLTYGIQVLMSLMMVSMIYVMLTMSAESVKRICEVLSEESALTDPAPPPPPPPRAPPPAAEPRSARRGAGCLHRLSARAVQVFRRRGEIRAAGHRPPHRLGPDRRHPRRHRLEQIDPRAAHPPPLRRDGGQREGRRRGRA